MSRPYSFQYVNELRHLCRSETADVLRSRVFEIGRGLIAKIRLEALAGANHLKGLRLTNLNCSAESNFAFGEQRKT